jgi:hypothetical protein
MIAPIITANGLRQSRYEFKDRGRPGVERET